MPVVLETEARVRAPSASAAPSPRRLGGEPRGRRRGRREALSRGPAMARRVRSFIRPTNVCQTPAACPALWTPTRGDLTCADRALGKSYPLLVRHLQAPASRPQTRPPPLSHFSLSRAPPCFLVFSTLFRPECPASTPAPGRDAETARGSFPSSQAAVALGRKCGRWALFFLPNISSFFSLKGLDTLIS